MATMTKRPELKGEGKTQRELPATDLLPHPGNFPLCSVESRAAARAMSRPGEVREGDKGRTEDGSFWQITKDNATQRLRVVVWGSKPLEQHPLMSAELDSGTRLDEVLKAIADSNRESPPSSESVTPLGIDAVSRPEQDRSVAQRAIAPADRVGDRDGALTGINAGAIGARASGWPFPF